MVHRTFLILLFAKSHSQDSPWATQFSNHKTPSFIVRNIFFLQGRNDPWHLCFPVLAQCLWRNSFVSLRADSTKNFPLFCACKQPKSIFRLRFPSGKWFLFWQHFSSCFDQHKALQQLEVNIWFSLLWWRSYWFFWLFLISLNSRESEARRSLSSAPGFGDSTRADWKQLEHVFLDLVTRGFENPTPRASSQVVVGFSVPQHCPCQYFIFYFWECSGHWECSAGIVPGFFMDPPSLLLPQIAEIQEQLGYHKLGRTHKDHTPNIPSRDLINPGTMGTPWVLKDPQSWPQIPQRCSSCCCPHSKPEEFPDFPPMRFLLLPPLPAPPQEGILEQLQPRSSLHPVGFWCSGLTPEDSRDRKRGERKSRQPQNINISSLCSVKTEHLERTWRNQLGACIALSLSIIQEGFLWIKEGILPWRRISALKGKVFSALTLAPGSLCRCWAVPKHLQLFINLGSLKWNLFPTWVGFCANLFETAQMWISFMSHKFSALFFFLPEMDPCSEFSWSTAKSTSILYFQPVHEWFLLGFFSCFDSSLQSLETQNIWIKIPYSDAMLVVNFVRFG